MGGIAFYFKVHELVEGETLSGVFITAVESYYKIAISPFSVETEKLHVNITFYFSVFQDVPLPLFRSRLLGNVRVHQLHHLTRKVSLLFTSVIAVQ